MQGSRIATANIHSSYKPPTSVSLPIAMCAMNSKLAMSGLKVRPAPLYYHRNLQQTPTEHATSYDTRSM